MAVSRFLSRFDVGREGVGPEFIDQAGEAAGREHGGKQGFGFRHAAAAVRAGWEVEFDLMVNLPEYVSPVLLNDVIGAAGRLIGLADFRPTYGRFQVINFSGVTKLWTWTVQNGLLKYGLCKKTMDFTKWR